MSPPMDFHEQEAKVHSLEVYEEDDDVFYDELRRQVLQLTAEDDNDDVEEVYAAKFMNVIEARKQDPKPICYGGWPGIKEDCAATPAWMVNLWRSGNGTGVFIPQGVQSRRKNRSRRKKESVRTWRQIERMK